ncbi:hypothetical protein [Aliikangiella maris]|uniref:Uncharacterized protein n=2 Tax=Aliikangiella maris TaxID=3162458 RepID=A0ABV2BZC4_9GAMM
MSVISRFKIILLLMVGIAIGHIITSYLPILPHAFNTVGFKQPFTPMAYVKNSEQASSKALAEVDNHSGQLPLIALGPSHLDTDTAPATAQIEQAFIEKLQQQEKIIADLQTQIANLKASLKSDSNQAPPPKLKTISVDDFEKEVKDKLFSHFKGYAIKLGENELENIKKSFDGQQTRSNWSAEFENNMNAFFSESNADNRHFIEELNCNDSMCRLKVDSSDMNNWQQIYAQMTQQDWYQSITLVESTDSPNQIIYYIPKHF